MANVGESEMDIRVDRIANGGDSKMAIRMAIYIMEERVECPVKKSIKSCLKRSVPCLTWFFAFVRHLHGLWL